MPPTERHLPRAIRLRGAAYVELLMSLALLGLGVLAATRYLAGSVQLTAAKVSERIAALSPLAPGGNAAHSGELTVRVQPTQARGLERGEGDARDPAESSGHEFDHADDEQAPQGADDSPNIWDRAKAYGGELLQHSPKLLADLLEVGTGVAATATGVEAAGEGVGLAVAGSETIVAVPAGAGIAVAGGALAVEGLNVAGKGLQHFSEDIQKVGNEAAEDVATEPTRALPKGEPNPSARARGTPEEVPRASKSMQQDIARQNESADRLAQEGYDIEHWDKQIENGSRPDYKINGEYVDHYNARSGSADAVRKEVAKKVATQAQRLVVRLDDSPLSIEEVKNLLSRPDKVVRGLKEIIFMKGDTITSFIP